MENQQLAIEVVRQYLEHEFPGRDVADFRDKAYHGHTFRVDDGTGTRVAGKQQHVAAMLRTEGRRKRVIVTRDEYNVLSL